MDYTQYWKIPKDLEKILNAHSGPIITRFPPENSGYLHIGHVKALMINYVIAKKYGGQMILRFDNTNPLTESLEFEKAIMDDIEKLGIVPDAITYSSDYFPILIKFAEELIQNNKAYIDDTPQVESKKQRRKCIESVNRNNSVEHNVELWNLMKDGNLKSACLRIKTDMKHPTGNCRDPAIFRYVEGEHYKIKDLKVFPTYDFVCPIIDSIEGVTHAFRSVEYSDRSDQYNLILGALNLTGPKLFYYGKVKFEGVVLSKRKIGALITNGTIYGWDDPRLFTVRGLLNHGIHVETLNQFSSTLGFSAKTPPIMTTEKLWTLNRKIIDKFAARYFCLPENDVIEIKVNNVNTPYDEIPKYIKNANLGLRILNHSDKIFITKTDYSTLSENEEVSLLLWGNMIFNNGELTFNPNGDFKSTDKKLLWIASNNIIRVKIDSCTTSGPIVSNYYIGERELLNINKGDYVQFLKMSYCMCTNIDNELITFIELN